MPARLPAFFSMLSGHCPEAQAVGFARLFANRHLEFVAAGRAFHVLGALLWGGGAASEGGEQHGSRQNGCDFTAGFSHFFHLSVPKDNAFSHGLNNIIKNPECFARLCRGRRRVFASTTPHFSPIKAEVEEGGDDPPAQAGEDEPATVAAGGGCAFVGVLDVWGEGAAGRKAGAAFGGRWAKERAASCRKRLPIATSRQLSPGGFSAAGEEIGAAAVWTPGRGYPGSTPEGFAASIAGEVGQGIVHRLSSLEMGCFTRALAPMRIWASPYQLFQRAQALPAEFRAGFPRLRR